MLTYDRLFKRSSRFLQQMNLKRATFGSLNNLRSRMATWSLRQGIASRGPAKRGAAPSPQSISVSVQAPKEGGLLREGRDSNEQADTAILKLNKILNQPLGISCHHCLRGKKVVWFYPRWSILYKVSRTLWRLLILQTSFLSRKTVNMDLVGSQDASVTLPSSSWMA